MAPFALIRALLEQASAQGSRSTVLAPIGWMMPICVAGALGAVGFGAPIWLVILFAIFAALTMVLYLGAYIYCLVKDRDALRSETYSIQRLALEKGFVGDSLSGVFPLESPSTLPPAQEESEETQ